MASQSCEKIHVYGRIRPSKNGSRHKVVNINGTSISIALNDETKNFGFDGAFGEDSTQEQIFEVLRRVVSGTLDGYNSTIFAYGQTGSGKTHTMIGPTGKLDQQAGIIPRSFQLIFAHLEQKLEELGRDSFKFDMSICIVQIYNEIIYDLISGEEKLRLSHDKEGCIVVRGAAEEYVKNVSDAMGVVMKGWENRIVAETGMNRASSRSHALVLVKIRTEEVHGSISTQRSASLNLVDLAGSERVSQSKVEGQQLKEATYINKSLLTLKRVIRELAESKNKGYNGHRDSLLTHILKDSFGGNSRTAVIINVHPDKEYYAETMSTLKFSTEVRMIENKLIVNEDLKGDSVLAFQVEIRRLKDQLEEASRLEIERWKEAANRYERQLALSQAQYRNMSMAVKREGHGCLTKEDEIWEKSMNEIAESSKKNLGMIRDIESIDMNATLQKLQLFEFEKIELQTELEEERKTKNALQERLNRYLEGSISPRRGQSSSQESIGPSSLSIDSSKKMRRRTMYTPSNKHRQSTFFRSVLNIEEEVGEMIEEQAAAAGEEDNEILEMEIKINTQAQIIDDTKQECSNLTSMLSEKELILSEKMEEIRKIEEEKKIEKDKREEIEKTFHELQLKMTVKNEEMNEMERSRNVLMSEIDEMKQVIEGLESEAELKESMHKDELRAKEERLRSNLSDKEAKEIDLRNEIDELKKKNEDYELQMENNESQKKAMNEIIDVMYKKNRELIDEKNKIESEVLTLRPTLNDYKNDLKKKEDEIDDLKRTINSSSLEHRSEVDELESRLERLKMESTDRYNEQSRIHSNRVISLENAIETYKANLATNAEEYSVKIREMMEEFDESKRSERTKMIDMEKENERLQERLTLTEQMKNELDEHVQSVSNHANKKQKFHLFERVMRDKDEYKERIIQLEKILRAHNIVFPMPPVVRMNNRRGEENVPPLNETNDNGSSQSNRRTRATKDAVPAASTRTTRSSNKN